MFDTFPLVLLSLIGAAGLLILLSPLLMLSGKPPRNRLQARDDYVQRALENAATSGVDAEPSLCWLTMSSLSLLVVHFFGDAAQEDRVRQVANLNQTLLAAFEHARRMCAPNLLDYVQGFMRPTDLDMALLSTQLGQMLQESGYAARYRDIDGYEQIVARVIGHFHTHGNVTVNDIALIASSVKGRVLHTV